MKRTLFRLLATSARKEGNAARDRRDWAAAAAAFGRYLAFRPYDAALRIQLAHMLKEDGDLAGAAHAYETARRGDPDNLAVMIWLGDVYRRQGRLDDARDMFAARIAIDDDETARSDLAATLDRMREAADDHAAASHPLEVKAMPQQRDEYDEAAPNDLAATLDRMRNEADDHVATSHPAEVTATSEQRDEGDKAARNDPAATFDRGRNEADDHATASHPAEVTAMPQQPDEYDGTADRLTQAAIVAPMPPPGEPRSVGHVDWAADDLIAGWARDPDRPGEPVDIDFSVDGLPVGSTTSHVVRGDLAAIGGLGFKAQIDLAGMSGELAVAACLRTTGEHLCGSPFPLDRAAERDLAPLGSSARFVIVKPLEMAAATELALFVTHSRTGTIKPHVAHHIRALAAAGIGTLLIVVGDRPMDVSDELLSLVAGAFVRENRGYDFACWSHALRLYPQAWSASILYLVNDSVFGPSSQEDLGVMIDRIRASGAALVGLTESHEHRWHVQSYFLALKADLLASLTIHDFFGGVRMYASKDEVIQRYEIALAPLVEQAGFAVEILFPSHAVRNPTLFGWRELIAHGFPYVKLLLLRGEFGMIELGDWRATLTTHGFDLPLLDATLATGTEGWAAATDHALLARPLKHRFVVPRPLKVAFFGPWNYDNGLGSASRGLIAALRRCGVQISLHPIEKPFHVHRMLAPPVAISDFLGPADIAIVHLNPDSWFLLTDEQRDLIRAAGKRIGHWVWEMAHIPPAWRHDFASVDRIWAPSGYCAGIFAAGGNIPVDVVPYTVPLPEVRLERDERERILRGLGLAADRRVILYAFDGSSYLIRKNPAALVRAFHAAGLADRGWSLVLKTKHLFDREAEGHALETLAMATPGVVLVNAAMSAGEMAHLAALADIYASPHCSEGFGLTIAEAMAAGKPVVATDFGGSTQFLDARCGYPVRADAWTLEADFGHYTKGGSWARIDETALAGALDQAAAVIDAGDTHLGEAARQRVADTLSYEAIGRLMAASFDKVLADAPVRPTATPRLVHDLVAGTRFGDARLDLPLVAVPLAPDCTPPAALPDDLPGDRATWLVFAPADAMLAPRFQRIVGDQCGRRLDADIYYADDVALGEDTLGEQIRLKPAFDASLLAADNYIGVPLIVRASAFARLGGFDRTAGAAAIDDLLFRAYALGLAIVPIRATLLAWPGRRPVAPRDLRRRVLAKLPAFAAHDLVDGIAPNSIAVRRRFTDRTLPAVTIVIPTRRSMTADGTESHVERLLRLLADTDWPMDRLRVLVGDDIPGRPAWAASNRPFTLDRIETPRPAGEPFNYAAKMNLLWRASMTEHLVLMNDDVSPVEAGWLRALMTFSIDGSVGGVGPRLLYGDGTIQHAGIAPIFGLVAHPWLGLAADAPTYQNWANVQREWSMMTGAVFATRRTVMEQLNGFDERFALEYNDVDLCLRMRALGYRIVYTPQAEMVHVEKASRGPAPPPAEDLALFRERWQTWLRDDPAYHPQLGRDRFAVEPVVDPNAWYLC